MTDQEQTEQATPIDMAAISQRLNMAQGTLAKVAHVPGSSALRQLLNDDVPALLDLGATAIAELVHAQIELRQARERIASLEAAAEQATAVTGQAESTGKGK